MRKILLPIFCLLIAVTTVTAQSKKKQVTKKLPEPVTETHQQPVPPPPIQGNGLPPVPPPMPQNGLPPSPPPMRPNGQPPFPPPGAPQWANPKDIPLPFRPDSLMPYWTDHNLPALKIRKMDSVTIFNTAKIPTGSTAALIYFDPECKHCNAFAEAVVGKMDSLKDVMMYWMTANASMTAVKQFYKEHGFEKYKNIKIVGRDYEFAFMDFFNTKGMPSAAIYDKNKKLVKLIDAIPSVDAFYYFTHLQ